MMNHTSYYSNFVHASNKGDIDGAHKAAMSELGRILATSRRDFVDLLQQSGIDAHMEMSDTELINLFVDALPDNPELMLGSALLMNTENANSGFDGNRINDASTKAAYQVMRNYFTYGGEPYMAEEHEGYSNSAGLIAGAVGQVASTVGSFAERSRQREFGALDYAQQKEATKQAMIQAATAERQAQIKALEEQKAKRKRTTTIIVIGSVVAAVGIVATIIVLKKRK